MMSFETFVTFSKLQIDNFVLLRWFRKSFNLSEGNNYLENSNEIIAFRREWWCEKEYYKQSMYPLWYLLLNQWNVYVWSVDDEYDVYIVTFQEYNSVRFRSSLLWTVWLISGHIVLGSKTSHIHFYQLCYEN